MRIPMPRSESSLIIPLISATAIGSIPAKGSSRSKNFGSIASDRAISVRRRSPPESVIACCPLIFPISNSLMSCSSLIFFSSNERSRLVSRIAQIFSSTVSFLNTDGSCGRYEMPSFARLYMGSAVIRSWSKNTSPEVGR